MTLVGTKYYNNPEIISLFSNQNYIESLQYSFDAIYSISDKQLLERLNFMEFFILVLQKIEFCDRIGIYKLYNNIFDDNKNIKEMISKANNQNKFLYNSLITCIYYNLSDLKDLNDEYMSEALRFIFQFFQKDFDDGVKDIDYYSYLLNIANILSSCKAFYLCDLYYSTGVEQLERLLEVKEESFLYLELLYYFTYNNLESLINNNQLYLSNCRPSGYYLYGILCETFQKIIDLDLPEVEVFEIKNIHSSLHEEFKDMYSHGEMHFSSYDDLSLLFKESDINYIVGKVDNCGLNFDCHIPYKLSVIVLEIVEYYRGLIEDYKSLQLNKDNSYRLKTIYSNIQTLLNKNIIALGIIFCDFNRDDVKSVSFSKMCVKIDSQKKIKNFKESFYQKIKDLNNVYLNGIYRILFHSSFQDLVTNRNDIDHRVYGELKSYDPLKIGFYLKISISITNNFLLFLHEHISGKEKN